jgi:choline kinase
LPSSAPVRRAIILAAGNGDRFCSPTHESKLVRAVLGVPLIVRTLRSAVRAGIRSVDIVLGYDAANVRGVVLRDKPAALSVRFHDNPRWHEENGLSALAARGAVGDGRFALLMGDHLFDSEILHRLVRTPAADGECLLAIDRHSADPVNEATRVVLDGDGRIVTIGKGVDPFDAVDTGLFVCAPTLFSALDESCRDGDTTLSGGIRVLAARGLMRGVDIGERAWCDIDTTDDLGTAEDLLRKQPA